MKTYGISETQTLVSILLDENGEPRLDTLAPHPRPEDWMPPNIVPLIKLPKPEDFDITTHYVQPKLVWFEDRVERDWELVPIPQSTLEQQASSDALAAIKAANAEKLRRLYAPYLVQPEGFSLATQESDQNAFTRLITLLQVSKAPPEYQIEIADSSGNLHTVTVERFFQIMVGYGMEFSARWTNFKK